MKTKVSFVRISTAGATESKDNGTIFGGSQRLCLLNGVS